MFRDQNSELFIPLEPSRERAHTINKEVVIKKPNIWQKHFMGGLTRANMLGIRWERFLQNHKTFRAIWWIFEAAPMVCIVLFFLLIFLLFGWGLA
jgi:hypothetical protein